MTRVYIFVLAIAAFSIALVGATFSIFGLSKLFAGAATSIILMASALEFAKLVTTGFLYRYWGHINYGLRAYLVFAVVTLVGITSVGIFGYLSHAYQIASVDLKQKDMKIQSLQAEQDRIKDRIAEINKFIDDIPASRISRKFEFKKQYEPEIKKLRASADQVVLQVEQSKIDMVSTHAEIGPIIYLAQALGEDVDTVVRYLILVFVIVFDPLAVCLVFCLNLAIRLNEKYRGNEFKIGAHAISTPVDHRYKKAA